MNACLQVSVCVFGKFKRWMRVMGCACVVGCAVGTRFYACFLHPLNTLLSLSQHSCNYLTTVVQHLATVMQLSHNTHATISQHSCNSHATLWLRLIVITLHYANTIAAPTRHYTHYATHCHPRMHA